MRVLEDLHWFKCAGMEVEHFHRLPQRAKELIVNVVNSILIGHYGKLDDLVLLFEVTDICSVSENCKSPIEQIFEVACNIVFVLRGEEIGGGWFESESQYEVKCGTKKYYADFCFYHAGSESGDRDSNILLVECDGHDFHKATKQQVKHDNERDYDLRMAGYELLHFSGTQIYEDPIKCANDTFDYLIKLREKGAKE